jgi:hypothetical protein
MSSINSNNRVSQDNPLLNPCCKGYMMLHFADDTIVYLTITSDTDADYLQEDLDKLAEWEGKWKMAFHPDKCNVLTPSHSANLSRSSCR